MLGQNLGTIQNISQKGILLKVTHPVNYNYVEMNFYNIMGMRLKMDGKVIHCKETPSGQYEIGISLARNGIKKIVIINGHGGNSPSLNFAAQMINRDARIFVSVDSGETSDVDIYQMVETPNDVHAGEIETSSAMFLRPMLISDTKAKKFVPQFSSRFLNFSSKRGVGWYTRTAKISTSGVMGDPTKASRQKGEAIWAVMINRLVEFVEDLKNMTLDEIYQKKY